MKPRRRSRMGGAGFSLSRIMDAVQRRTEPLELAMDAIIPRASKIGALRDLLENLLLEHERDGMLPTNARFLWYELIQRGQQSKERTGARRPDQNLHDALTDIREDGRIPWDWIVDETRSIEDYTGYPTIKQGVLAQLPYIKLDPWRGGAPLILTESRSLAGVLRPIVSECCARIASTNGQCGGFLRTEVAPLLRPGDHVIYLGDLDLSGGQIEENTRRVLEREIGGPLRWERLALTEQQVIAHSLPVIIKHDRRYKDGRPHEAVETEAIGQSVLIDILRTRLNELLPEPLARVLEREARQRKRLGRLLRGAP
jgi:hypothetical protein